MRTSILTIGTISIALLFGCTLDYDGHDDEPPWHAQDAGWIYNDADPWQVDGGPCDEDAGPVDFEDGGIIDPEDAGPVDFEDGGIIDPEDGGIIAPGCSTILDEAICIVTPECEALYVGVDCECYEDGSCTCESWEFLECQ